MPETLTIPAGQNSAALTFLAITNSTGANPETVVVTLRTNPSYSVGSPNSATATLLPTTAAIFETATFWPPSGIVIHWSSVAGGSYRILAKTDLSSGSWQDMSGVITASGTDTWWTGSVAGASSRFYRIWRVN